MPEETVVVGTFANDVEAHFAKTLLEAANIPVQVLTHGVSGLDPDVEFAAGVRLLVPAALAAEAHEVLEESGDPL